MQKSNSAYHYFRDKKNPMFRDSKRRIMCSTKEEKQSHQEGKASWYQIEELHKDYFSASQDITVDSHSPNDSILYSIKENNIEKPRLDKSPSLFKMQSNKTEASYKVDAIAC